MAKILIIDDDPKSIESIKDDLSFEHEVYFTRNIDEAIQLLMKETYDLIILDLYMPYRSHYKSSETLNGRETGYLLLKEIRSGEAGFKVNKNVPVIALTHIRMDEHLKEKVLREKPIEFVQKPPSLSEMNLVVDRLLAEGESKEGF